MWNNFHKAVLTVVVITIIFPDFSSCRRDHCPEVKRMKDFNIFAILGPWYVVQYYSSSEEALTYHCMRTEFGLSNGNMDMKMRLTYKYVADPNDETQRGNITWQIPDPMRPEHWRHTEDHYKGVYNTDVVDTDHNSWLILLHCSDPESEKKFLSTFVLSRTPFMDKLTMEYLKEKVGQYDVDLEYLFPVNQTFCFGENLYETPPTTTEKTTTTESPDDDGDNDSDMYFAEGDQDQDKEGEMSMVDYPNNALDANKDGESDNDKDQQNPEND